jgi:hypothetical protein
MGFSLLGLVIGLAILAPNVLLAIAPPRGGIPTAGSPGVVFTVFERLGQVGCLVLLAITPASPSPWLIAVGAGIAAYWALWARYVVRREFWWLYAPVLRIPIPMAVVPVLTFASAAAWLWSPWLALATLALAVGHLATSWHVYREIAATSRSSP